MLAGRTGGSRGTADTFLIEKDQHGFAFDAAKREARRVWQTMDTISVHLHAFHAFEDARFKFVAHALYLRGLKLDGLPGKFTSLPKPHDAGHVFRARTPSAFLAAAGHR